jgi:hypothetical protein
MGMETLGWRYLCGLCFDGVLGRVASLKDNPFSHSQEYAIHHGTETGPDSVD